MLQIHAVQKSSQKLKNEHWNEFILNDRLHNRENANVIEKAFNQKYPKRI